MSKAVFTAGVMICICTAYISPAFSLVYQVALIGISIIGAIALGAAYIVSAIKDTQ